MVDKVAYKKAQKKRRIRFATIVSAAAVAALIIVAFLSTYVGNFTISVVNYNSKLAFSTDASMDDQTTYIKTAGFTKAVEADISDADTNTSTFDAATTNGGLRSIYYYHNKEAVATQFYAYTFFVSNVGKDPCHYYYGMNITNEQASSSGMYVSKMIRIRIFENSLDGETHNYYDYTAANGDNAIANLDTADIDYAGKKAYLESCATASSLADGTSGKLYYFNDGSNIISSAGSIEKLYPGHIIRYTIVMWIEGYDPDCTGDYDTTGVSTLRLTAYIGSYTSD